MLGGEVRKKTVIENATVPRDKRKYCLHCKYHGWLTSFPPQLRTGEELPESQISDNLYCNRSTYEHESCLKDRGGFRTNDSRGDGPGCELFQPGKPKNDEGNDYVYSKWVKGVMI